MKIAVDAMGGDFAPGIVIDGAILAARDHKAEIILVGDEAVIRKELEEKGGKGLSISIKHAPETVSMEDSASVVIRKKRASSINVAFELVRDGSAGAFVSAGNSGAAMVAACSVIKRLPGIDRPAIAVLLPNVNGHCLLLDAGANVDCKKAHLVQFAIMGSVYAQYAMGIENPRIAVLSNGSEESKGTELTREANQLLKKSSLNYLGYGEGRDIYNGSCDVIVCDGFIGNIALKTSEGVADACFAMAKKEILKSNLAKLGALLMKNALKKIKKRVDYAETGGAPLLGINGVGIISHGGSNGKAIKNAILVARRNIKANVNSYILKELEKNAHILRDKNQV